MNEITNDNNENSSSLRSDLFLSHNWGLDGEGRNNHQRVAMLNDALNRAAVETWFDNENLDGHIDASMASGIERSQMIVIFITRAYMKKVAGKGLRGVEDNCYKEFSWSVRKKTAFKMISVVMESDMRDTTEWEGPLGDELARSLYIDFSSNELLGSCAREIVKKLDVGDRIVDRTNCKGRYIGMLNANGDKDGIGRMEYTRGGIYDGAYINGKRDFPHSRHEYPNGDVYEGAYVNDRKHGAGTMKYRNGDEYVGSWVNDKREGHGKLTTGQKTVEYEGFFKNNKGEGEGTKKFADGSKYTGAFVKDLMHGKGKMVYGKGKVVTGCNDVYDGNWKDGKRHGKGQMIYANGDKYDGDWINDKRKGKGQMIYANGDAYDGEWNRDGKEGKGEQRYQNGDEYKGQFYQNLIHGKGTTKFARTGDQYEGDFRMGKKNGKGKYTFYQGHFYDGDWKENKIEGYGLYAYSKRHNYNRGDIYQGYFKNNQRNGEGRMEFATGAIYDGQWRMNMMHGNGKCDFEDITKGTQRVFFRRFRMRSNGTTLFAVTFEKNAVVKWSPLNRNGLSRKKSLLGKIPKDTYDKVDKSNQTTPPANEANGENTQMGELSMSDSNQGENEKLLRESDDGSNQTPQKSNREELEQLLREAFDGLKRTPPSTPLHGFPPLNTLKVRRYQSV